MKIRLIAVGPRQPDWVQQAYTEYAGRLPRECSLELQELALAPRSKKPDPKRAMADEAQRIGKAIIGGSRVVALDERGQAWTTVPIPKRLAEWLGLLRYLRETSSDHSLSAGKLIHRILDQVGSTGAVQAVLRLFSAADSSLLPLLDEFLDLLKHPVVDYFMRPTLGDHYIVSNYLSVIAGPGNEPQQLHYDQTGVQPGVTAFPVGMNILWFLDDVTEANGGTRVFPGSHEVHVGPDDIFVSDGTVAAEGPAGSAMVFDTRLWHGTGANRTDKRRHVIITLFYRAWMRPQINPWTSIHPRVSAKFDETLKTLFGYRCTSTHGGREDQIEGEFNGYDPDALICEMRPKT